MLTNLSHTWVVESIVKLYLIGDCVGKCSVGSCGGENQDHDIEGQMFESVIVKMQENSQMVFKIHQTLLSACFGVCMPIS